MFNPFRFYSCKGFDSSQHIDLLRADGIGQATYKRLLILCTIVASEKMILPVNAVSRPMNYFSSNTTYAGFHPLSKFFLTCRYLETLLLFVILHFSFWMESRARISCSGTETTCRGMPKRRDNNTLQVKKPACETLGLKRMCPHRNLRNVAKFNLLRLYSFAWITTPLPSFFLFSISLSVCFINSISQGSDMRSANQRIAATSCLLSRQTAWQSDST